MGNLSCCLKPEEKKVEITGNQEQVEIIEEYPHDSNVNKNEGNDGLIKSPQSNEHERLESNPNIQSPKDGDAEQEVNSPKQEEGAEEGQDGEQGEEQGGEEVEHEEVEQGEEQVEEQVEEQGEEQGEFEAQDPLIGDTIAQTTYINANNNNFNNVQQVDQPQVQIVKNEEELNQYFSQVGKAPESNVNEYLSSYNQSQGFINASTNQEGVDLNSLQMIPSTTENNEYNQYIQQGAENATGNEDYSQYFQQGASAVSGNVDLTSYGTTSAVQASTGNEQLDQYFKDSTVSGNYDFNNLGQSNTGDIDLGQYNLVSGTTSTTGNIDLNAFGIQGSAISADAATSSYGIPGGDINVTFGEQQNAQNFSEYQATKVTTTKVAKSYAGPTQSYSYNYSYNISSNPQ